jgi:hypothetical protein
VQELSIVLLFADLCLVRRRKMVTLRFREMSEKSAQENDAPLRRWLKHPPKADRDRRRSASKTCSAKRNARFRAALPT